MLVGLLTFAKRLFVKWLINIRITRVFLYTRVNFSIITMSASNFVLRNEYSYADTLKMLRKAFRNQTTAQKCR